MNSTIEILKRNGLFPSGKMHDITAEQLAKEIAKQYLLTGDALEACIQEGLMPELDKETKITEEMLADIIVRLLER